LDIRLNIRLDFGAELIPVVNAEDLGDEFQAFAVGEGDGLLLEGFAQRLRHSLRIAKIAHGTFPLLWRIRFVRRLRC
jgi:hypothetical protein